VRAISFGLGPIGCEIARTAAARPGVEIVGAVDVDPAKVGSTLRDVAGAARDVLVAASLDQALTAAGGADVLLHSTTSSLRAAWEQAAPAVARGISVVSTCEELSYPWRTQAGIAREIDAAARASGARVLGTGVNPGYAMDALPLVLTGPCQSVRRIEIERVVDAGARRGPLQCKVGAGLTPREFDELVRDGRVRHVGLAESAWMLLDGLGWEVQEVEEVIEPVLAEREISTELLTVAPGRVAGVRQTLRALREGEECLSLRLAMYVGAEAPYDRVRVWGVPDLDVTVSGGIHGDRATAAMVLNCVPALPERPAGLLTMLDLVGLRSR
jgi:4-hydroxy-tetrahydrodipicolinate reductase